MQIDGWNARRLDELARDVRDQGIDVKEIKNTLLKMQSDEMASLRRRADLPRRLMLALGFPIATGTIVALLSNVHF